MTVGDSLADLSPAEVCARCRDETARYRRRETHDDRYCFEMIRRAVAARDDRCWEALYTIYHDQVLSWCRRAGSALTADPDELVALAWGKFWRSYTPDKLETSSGTAGVLKYVQLCCYSVVTDVNRAYSPAASLDQSPIERAGTGPTPEEEATEQASNAALWETVGRHLRDERERMLMYLMFQIGLKPAEVRSARSDLFPTVGEVYSMKRNILDRLARSAELKALLGDDDR